MVQVDVFWSYGIGASMALAAGRQLRARREIARAEPPAPLPGDPPDLASPLRNPFFVKTVLYAALLFAPSGAYLLWKFPSWETMHAGDRDLAAWLVVCFAVTNVTQAMLGFWVVERLVTAGRRYLAYLQVVGAYAAMFFILVHGWDGQGYRRFFSPTRADFLRWHGDWSSWLTSDVAVTLYAMGLVLVPVLLGTIARWQTAGYELAGPGERQPRAAVVVALNLATVFGAALGIAVLASVTIHALGAAAGIPAALALAASAGLPRGPIHRVFAMLGQDSGYLRLPNASSLAVAAPRAESPSSSASRSSQRRGLSPAR